jgi:hypothetical protein
VSSGGWRSCGFLVRAMARRTPWSRVADVTRRTTLRLVIALVIIFVAVPTVRVCHAGQLSDLQQWIADHWVPREDDRTSRCMELSDIGGPTTGDLGCRQG